MVVLEDYEDQIIFLYYQGIYLDNDADEEAIDGANR